ncbi:MAG TPA: ABC transporter permease [Gemmatimonadaceae bacterium]|nr:ABC transporter permease [Gemmatimonadaceae bacterium]
MRHILADALFRIRALLDRRAQRELDEELRFHLDMDAAALRSQGLAPAEAERVAQRQLGSMRREAERVRDAWGVSLADEFVADVRHALRQMRRRAGYTAIVILTLGLGIGATVALFSVVSDLLLRPLPYAHADQVHVFWSDYDWRGEEYDFLRDRAGVFRHLAAFSTNDDPYRSNAADPGGARLLPFVVATSTLFDVLGTRPLIGRPFDATEDRPGAAPVIVISYGMWREDLGGDPRVIGRRIIVGDVPVTVVGVMPKGFFFPTPDIRAWRPLALDPKSPSYFNGYLTLLGRTAPGVRPVLVASDIRRIARALGSRFTYPAAWDKTKNPYALGIRTYLLGDVRDPLMLLLAAAALLLGIACANAAALILARTSDRSSEMAVRTALGAGQWRLARQVLAESLVLAAGAAVLGVAIATAGFRALVAVLPLGNGFGATVSIGWATFASAFVLALAIALAGSAAPIRDLVRGGGAVNRERSEEGLRRGTRRVHGAIIVSQVAFAVLLVLGATLLIRSVDNLRAVNMGFDPHGVSTYTLVTSDNMSTDAQRQFFDQVLARVSALPGVRAAGLTNRLPVRDGGYQGPVGIEGRPDLDGANRPNSLYRTVTPAYFAAMGLRVRDGRGIDSTDVMGGLPVTVISESFARRMWPGQSALGKHIYSGWSGTIVPLEVVGVTHEARLTSVTGEIPFVMFVPLAQQASISGGVLVVRSSMPPAALMPAVRRAIAEIDPRVAVARIATMDDVVAGALAEPLRLRFFLTVFAAIALVLGTIGVYGVVSYAVSRRRAEFAVRMALGASPTRVLREVVERGVAPVIAGVAIGMVAALALSGLLHRFLYGLGAADPLSLGAAAGALLAAGVAAALVPAARAGRTSPAEALRAD